MLLKSIITYQVISLSSLFMLTEHKDELFKKLVSL